jgi:hypothetical protein
MGRKAIYLGKHGVKTEFDKLNQVSFSIFRWQTAYDTLDDGVEQNPMPVGYFPTTILAT